MRSSQQHHALYGPDLATDGADTDSLYFLTALNHPKPWLEIQLSSEVAGVAGLEILCSAPATKYLGDVRISAGTQPAALVEGQKATTVEQVNTYIGKFKGPEGGGKTVYVSFPEPLLVKYILLQKEADSYTRLSAQGDIARLVSLVEIDEI